MYSNHTANDATFTTTSEAIASSSTVRESTHSLSSNATHSSSLDTTAFSSDISSRSSSLLHHASHFTDPGAKVHINNTSKSASAMTASHSTSDSCTIWRERGPEVERSKLERPELEQPEFQQPEFEKQPKLEQQELSRPEFESTRLGQSRFEQ